MSFSLRPPDGLGSRPSAIETCSRSSSRIRSVTRRFSHCWNCRYTLCQGGKSTGSCRHEQTLRTTYKIASTIARRGCFGIRPGDLINGTSAPPTRTTHRSSPTDTAAHAPPRQLHAVPAAARDTPCDTTLKHSPTARMDVANDGIDARSLVELSTRVRALGLP